MKKNSVQSCLCVLQGSSFYKGEEKGEKKERRKSEEIEMKERDEKRGEKEAF